MDTVVWAMQNGVCVLKDYSDYCSAQCVRGLETTRIFKFLEVFKFNI